MQDMLSSIKAGDAERNRSQTLRSEPLQLLISLNLLMVNLFSISLQCGQIFELLFYILPVESYNGCLIVLHLRKSTSKNLRCIS